MKKSTTFHKKVYDLKHQTAPKIRTFLHPVIKYIIKL
nr:MAG TPA: hypothetical protein [Caudoviricetes sp.]